MTLPSASTTAGAAARRSGAPPLRPALALAMPVPLVAGLLALAASSAPTPALGFAPLSSMPIRKAKESRSIIFSAADAASADTIPNDDDVNEAEAEEEPTLNPRAIELKERLLSLSSSTDRGFRASDEEKKEARDVLFELAKFNPTEEPASPYYKDDGDGGGGEGGKGGGSPTLAGKWTLIYTDAPDITSLDTSTSPLPTLSAAKLGRIGQECSPPYIANVIEWTRPEWVPEALKPLSGGEDGGRVLQRVVTEGTARRDSPKVVELTVVGIDLDGDVGASEEDKDDDDDEKSSGGGPFGFLPEALRGGPARFLKSNPVELRGPLSSVVPFGRFEVLYLDDAMRAIKTGQNYVAVNVRVKEGEEWF